MASRLFADLSNNNPVFHPFAYRSAGHRLIALKATEGLGYVDPLHGPRANQAHHAGLRVLHYHFCRPDNHLSTDGEADAFMAAVKPFWREGDFLALDIEVVPRGGMHNAGPYLLHLDRRVIKLSGRMPIGYTYVAYMDEVGADLQVSSKRWWMASYGARVALLGHGRRRWAHQYTDGSAGHSPHRFAGIGDCDGSRLSAFALRDVKHADARARRQGAHR